MLLMLNIVTDKWRVEDKEVFKSRQINIHLNKIYFNFATAWRGFKEWDTDERQ